jgi:hypothetical protein
VKEFTGILAAKELKIAFTGDAILSGLEVESMAPAPKRKEPLKESSKGDEQDEFHPPDMPVAAASASGPRWLWPVALIALGLGGAILARKKGCCR